MSRRLSDRRLKQLKAGCEIRAKILLADGRPNDGFHIHLVDGSVVDFPYSDMIALFDELLLLRKGVGRRDVRRKWTRSDVRITSINDVMASVNLYGGVWMSGRFMNKAWVVNQQVHTLEALCNKGHLYYPTRNV